MILQESKQFEVALSFAGEQRGYVQEVALALQSRGVGVFYDEFEQTLLWGRHLPEELNDVYENRAKFVVMFVSEEYVSKAWPNHERKAALSRAIREREEYILPVRFDNSRVPGLSEGIHYLSAEKHPPGELATMIAEKLGISPFAGKASRVPPPRMTCFAAKYSTAACAALAGAVERSAMCL